MDLGGGGYSGKSLAFLTGEARCNGIYLKPQPPVLALAPNTNKTRQRHKPTSTLLSGDTQQVNARVTDGSAAVVPSSTYMRKSSSPSAASGVEVHGLPGPLFVEFSAPKA